MRFHSEEEVVHTVVTAAGCVGAVGSGVDALRSALESGRSGLRNAADVCGPFGHLHFSACIGLLPEEPGRAPRLAPFAETRQLRMTWAVIAQFEEQIRAAVARFGPERVGFILGTSTGGILSTEEALIRQQATGQLPADFSCQYGHNMDAAARYVAHKLDLLGPCYTVSAACASGAKALATGRRLIELGICDAVVAGGVDSICRMTLHGFHSLGVLSDEECKPFDSSGSGMNVAEGAALLLLQKAEGALDESSIVFLGVGESSDAHHMSAPDPTGESQACAMQRSLEDAGLSASQVGYVNAHGTGTKANDTAEELAIQKVVPGVPASSTKGIWGHQLGAAGATEALIVIEALRGVSIPPSGSTRKSQFPLRLSTPSAAMSNSFAFGGANISLTFAKGSCHDSGMLASRRRTMSGLRAGIRAAVSRTAGATDDARDWGRDLLSGRVRARASDLTRLGAELIVGLGLAKEQLAETPLIVGSALGQIRTTRRLLELFLNQDASPLLFQTSVHNAVAGALSLVLKNKKASSSVAGGEDTTFCTFLEALSYLWTHPEEDQVVVLCLEESPPKDLEIASYPSSGSAFLLHRDAGACAHRIELMRDDDFPVDDTLTPLQHLTPSLSSDAIALVNHLETRTPALLTSKFARLGFVVSPLA